MNCPKETSMVFNLFHKNSQTRRNRRFDISVVQGIDKNSYIRAVEAVEAWKQIMYIATKRMSWAAFAFYFLLHSFLLYTPRDLAFGYWILPRGWSATHEKTPASFSNVVYFSLLLNFFLALFVVFHIYFSQREPYIQASRTRWMRKGGRKPVLPGDYAGKWSYDDLVVKSAFGVFEYATRVSAFFMNSFG